MRHNYPYLNNTDFLFALAKEKITNLFIKIIVLTMDEKPIKEVQGKVLSGNINVDGDSAVRRTGNLSVFIDEKDASYMEIGGLFSINKKIKIEIGILNRTNQYHDYPILWFPQGTYAIINLSSSYGTSGTTISLQIKDKMVFLNGECGGIIPNPTVFDEYETIDPATGEYVIEKPTILQILYELVNHFGGEQLGKIIISDLDTEIKKVMKWTQSNYLYLYAGENSTSAAFSLNPYYKKDSQIVKDLQENIELLEEIKKETITEEEREEIDKEIQNFQKEIEIEQNSIQEEGPGWILKKVYSAGDDIGYIYSDFYFPRELIGNAGDSVCTILDTIKNTLGNFEYFYDLDGNFIFREIKNYLNTSQSTHALRSGDASNYLIDRTNGKAAYDFSNSDIIISLSNSPQYGNVKNDFIVWGMRETVADKTLPIRYHLAIDSKPKIGNTYHCYFYDDPEAINLEDLSAIKKAKVAIDYNSVSEFPNVGEIGRVYYSKSEDKGYYWDRDKPIEVSQNDLIPKEEIEDENGVVKYYTYYNPTTLRTIKTTDWREELFFSGVNTTKYGNDSNYYYVELENEWTKLFNYDLATPTWKDSVINNPTGLDYFLDFIDSSAAISEFSISNIGRRTHIINDDSINCIFEPEIPDYILLEADGEGVQEEIDKCNFKGQNYISVTSDIYKGIAQGGNHNSAFNMIQDLLYQYTGYNESISLQILPLYFLEPNIRITVNNDETGIHGDYMLNNFSIPLDINGTMSLSCTKALERI